MAWLTTDAADADPPAEDPRHGFATWREGLGKSCTINLARDARKRIPSQESDQRVTGRSGGTSKEAAAERMFAITRRVQGDEGEHLCASSSRGGNK
jgi:hypothetical protein